MDFVPPPASPSHDDSTISADNRIKITGAHGLIKLTPTSDAATLIILSMLSFIAVIFCVIMIALGGTDPWFFSTITFVIGLFCPQPKLAKNASTNLSRESDSHRY